MDFLETNEELDLVPYSEEQRPENRTPESPGPIGGMWFCSEECRDEYKEGDSDE